MNCCRTTNKGMATIIATVAVPFFLLAACNFEKKEFVDISFNPEKDFTMKALTVSTLVSDSGVTKYRASAPVWYVFDKAQEPYWYFPEKVHVERFDTAFNIEASFDADTAYYFSKTRLWKFIGNVDVHNIEGERFETSLLYWDQNTERVYSDSFIRITKADFENTGTGFESNQTLTNYTIRNAGAVIPVRETADDASTDTTTTIISPPE